MGVGEGNWASKKTRKGMQFGEWGGMRHKSARNSHGAGLKQHASENVFQMSRAINRYYQG